MAPMRTLGSLFFKAFCMILEVTLGAFTEDRINNEAAAAAVSWFVSNKSSQAAGMISVNWSSVKTAAPFTKTPKLTWKRSLT